MAKAEYIANATSALITDAAGKSSTNHADADSHPRRLSRLTCMLGAVGGGSDESA